GLAWAVISGHWQMRQIYDAAYFPLAAAVWTLGWRGCLPRVKRSTRGEGHERRYFYGAAWAVCIAQPMLWLMWKTSPRGLPGDALKLLVFALIFVLVGRLAYLGRLPRTRVIAGDSIAAGL
ncbi:MAG: hypothetical protein ACRD96_07045, partial [Bryobacteraceae bacterium]